MTIPRGSSSNEDALTATLAEYQSLRSEITWLIEHGVRLQNYAIGLSIGVFPAAAFILEKSNPVFLVGLLLILPVVLSLLGILYFRQHQEVYVVAAYIREEIRPIIRELTGREDVWGWEEFKSARHKRVSQQCHALGLWRPRTIVVLRLAIFSLPALCALVLGISVAIGQGISDLNATYTIGGSVTLLLLAVTDVVMMVMFARQCWKDGDLERVVLDNTLPSGRMASPAAAP